MLWWGEVLRAPMTTFGPTRYEHYLIVALRLIRASSLARRNPNNKQMCQWKGWWELQKVQMLSCFPLWWQHEKDICGCTQRLLGVTSLPWKLCSIHPCPWRTHVNTAEWRCLRAGEKSQTFRWQILYMVWWVSLYWRGNNACFIFHKTAEQSVMSCSDITLVVVVGRLKSGALLLKWLGVPKRFKRTNNDPI